MILHRFFSIFLVFVTAALAMPSPSIADAEGNYNKVQSKLLDRSIKFYPFEGKNIDELKIKALQEKNNDHLYRIGMMYLKGINVKRDFRQAKEFLKIAAEGGNSNAMVELSKFYTYRKGVTGMDPSRNLARRWINDAEEAENPEAYYVKGLYFDKGRVFQRSYEKALSYYKEASDKGHFNAKVKLFLAFLFGKNVEKSIPEAINYLRQIRDEAPNKTIKQNAMVFLGEIYFDLAMAQTNPETRFKFFQLAWYNEYPRAADAMADMIREGVGVEKDYDRAYYWYQKSVEKFNSVYAMERMGMMHLDAPGDIERDYEKAMNLFKRAAERGGVDGAHLMGYMYHYGLGVEKDLKEAKEWFNKSKMLSKRAQKRREVNENFGYSKD